MINQCMTLLVQELEGEGIPAPLLCEFTLAAVWDDLARLAGETTPPTVRRQFEHDRDLAIVADGARRHLGRQALMRRHTTWSE